MLFIASLLPLLALTTATAIPTRRDGPTKLRLKGTDQCLGKLKENGGSTASNGVWTEPCGTAIEWVVPPVGQAGKIEQQDYELSALTAGNGVEVDTPLTTGGYDPAKPGQQWAINADGRISIGGANVVCVSWLDGNAVQAKSCGTGPDAPDGKVKQGISIHS
ncbi:hypothetical protein I302_105542 [Kwoniella bestiolae CBS 10118]|uniref:Ricin B lectin domain-containing protein n=1 Tax=Kwoniella bestiolae CBS 10118 TaxID=1296100 RepID=A0A1B9FTE2_9TREE|nr:hypothetical protein I302_08825 [Kwoniella bestiolae CBS 10118]OCF22044.1 hypothetical protein I302_08825 [Kwoniella bestiolae CBS 10118]